MNKAPVAAHLIARGNIGSDRAPSLRRRCTQLVGQGGAHAADGERGMFAQRNGGDHIRVHLIQRVPVDWISRSGLTADDTDAIRTLLLDRYAHWSPRLCRLITDNDGPYIQRPIFALPVLLCLPLGSVVPTSRRSGGGT